jgi:hypothetical protein
MSVTLYCPVVLRLSFLFLSNVLADFPLDYFPSQVAHGFLLKGNKLADESTLLFLSFIKRDFARYTTCRKYRVFWFPAQLLAASQSFNRG